MAHLGHHWWTVSLALLSCQVWFFTSKHLPLQSSTESKRARASIWHLFTLRFHCLGGSKCWVSTMSSSVVVLVVCFFVVYYLWCEIGRCLCAARHQGCWVQVEFTLILWSNWLVWEVFAIARWQEIQHVFFHTPVEVYHGYFPCSPRETHLFGRGGSQKMAKTQGQMTWALNAGHAWIYIYIPLECHRNIIQKVKHQREQHWALFM